MEWTVVTVEERLTAEVTVESDSINSLYQERTKQNRFVVLLLLLLSMVKWVNINKSVMHEANG